MYILLCILKHLSILKLISYLEKRTWGLTPSFLAIVITCWHSLSLERQKCSPSLTPSWLVKLVHSYIQCVFTDVLLRARRTSTRQDIAVSKTDSIATLLELIFSQESRQARNNQICNVEGEGTMCERRHCLRQSSYGVGI